MSEPGMTDSAQILQGPGLIRRPERLAGAVDRSLSDMVAGLESVADCQPPAVDLPDGLPPDIRLERFCDALAAMGQPLMAGLAQSYRQSCDDQRFAPDAHRALLDQRAQALTAYFLELARVHGVAFATEGQAPSEAGVTAALNTLRSALEAAYDTACRSEGLA
mgnify:CR=1 FL=1